MASAARTSKTGNNISNITTASPPLSSALSVPDALACPAAAGSMMPVSRVVVVEDVDDVVVVLRTVVVEEAVEVV